MFGCQETLFFGCYAVLAGVLFASNFVLIKVPIQMVLYTAPILYAGSHLSLRLRELDPVTGEKAVQSETVSRKDAMLFPIIGSGALLLLYIAYKFLPPYWVNLLLTFYLGVVGVAAMAETFLTLVEKLTPHSFHAMIFDHTFRLPGPFDAPNRRCDVKASVNQILCYILATIMGASWLYTKHWMLHNTLAICFSIQAIRLVSVGNFTIATILLGGLFFYDIFWVFGTEVMVTVAKKFEGPAKIIFPTSFNPWKQSILGLGDIVIPGIFIAMLLRFDSWLRTLPKDSKKEENKGSTKQLNQSPLQESVDIHETFHKKYFYCGILAYQAGLLGTAVIMIVFNRPQPALLYLVPACLAGLLIPAFLSDQIREVFQYSEEEEETAKKDTHDPTTNDEGKATMASHQDSNVRHRKEGAAPATTD